MSVNSKSGIAKVSYVSDSLLVTKPIVDSKIVSVSKCLGTTSKKAIDTFLSVLERSIAEDFTEYYNKFDEQYGTTYNGIEMATVDFLNGTSLIFSGTDLSSNFIGNKYCIRQVHGDKVRSFMVGESLDIDASVIGINLTEYTDKIAAGTWVYIEKCVNEVLACKFMTFDINKLSISFDMSVTDADIAKSVYVLLSEVIALGEKRIVPLYVLISQLPSEVGSFEVSERLVARLNNLRYDCQIFIP